MPEPSKAELAEAGVEIGVVSEIEPPRAAFREEALPGEPDSDVKIVLADGTALRERIERVPVEVVAVSAGAAADAGFNLYFTHALLAPDGAVAKGADGGFLIMTGSHRHEASFTPERLAGMSDAEVEAALLHAREQAAAKARSYFSGLAKGERIFGSRLAVS